MRSKLLFFSLFFMGTKAGDELGQISYTYSEESKKEMEERLARYNATFPPIFLSSGFFATDSLLNQQQINGTTRDVLVALQNPETFARHVVSSKKAACDRTKSFVGLSVVIDSRDEMTIQNTEFAGAYLYAPKKIDTVLLSSTLAIGNPTQINAGVHEWDHRFWHTHNIAQCNAKDAKRVGKQQTDTKLTRNERLSAPYNRRNKQAFIDAINEAKWNLAQLREDIHTLQAIPAGTLPDLALKRRLDCYENEAKQFAIYYDLPDTQSALPALLDKLTEDMNIAEIVYSQSEVYYELNAVINAQLSFYPHIFNDCCPKLRAWYSNIVPRYAEVVEEIDPERFTLTCKK